EHATTQGHGACSGKVGTTFPVRTRDHSRTWSVFRESGYHFPGSNTRPLKDMERVQGKWVPLSRFEHATTQGHGACSGKVGTTFPVRTRDHSRTWSVFRESGYHFPGSNTRPFKDLKRVPGKWVPLSRFE